MIHTLLKVLVPLFLALLINPPTLGSTITVTNTNDSGTGSLRDAIASANSGNTIDFNLVYPATITLSSGTLNISKNLTISGPGVSNLAIDGNNAVRVFSVSSGAAVTISDLTIKNGNCRKEYHCLGGGVWNLGTLTLANITVSGSSAFDGGGVMSYGGTLTLTNSTVWGNWSDSIGGGIFNACPSSVTIRNSTVWGNSSGEHGGGLANYNCTLTVINSTVSGNLANDGGGLFNYYSGTLTVASSTVSGNSASSYGGLYNWGGTIAFKNTIVANSGGGNCGSSGSATSYGHNLSDDGSCIFLTSTSDSNSTPAELDSTGLQDNGGSTNTIASLPSSPAVDAIPVEDCTDVSGNPVTIDQRGIARPQGPKCDIGAVELGASFSSFTGKLYIRPGSISTPPSFDLNSQFTLGASSNGINPLTEAVMLRLGTYQVTIPANSFGQLKKGAKAGGYVFSGLIDGASLSIQINSLGSNSYQFKAQGSPVDLTALINPIGVKLMIDGDTGTTSVYADF